MLCRQKKVLVIWPEFPRKASYSEYGLPFLVSGLRTALTCTKDDSVSLYGLMAQLREVKQPEELVLLKEAIDLTVKGFVKMMQTINPGMKEFQAQALVEHEARMSGSEYQGYPSITGAGENGCVLHYSTNRSKLDSGELVLVDIGAEYHGYTADITRTIPVCGVFSPEQKELYRLVLKAQQAGIAACKIGNSFNATHYAAKKVLADGLIQLGIIKEEAEVTRYFMHGTSHYLGLDVHDSGTRGPLKAGTVITVEPGIYITNGADCDPKWWGIGIRIEDDILITEDGPVVLSGALPRDVAGIELLMKKKR